MNGYDLDKYLLPIWSGKKMHYETAMFVGEESEITLLYEPSGKIELFNYGLEKTYVEGVDYVVEGRKVKRLKGSSLPYFPTEEYYLAEMGKYDIHAIKENCPDYIADRIYLSYGEADMFTSRQVAVSYTHNDAWKGEVPADKTARFPRFLKKLSAGEKCTVLFYGDSITTGCNSSGMPTGGNVAPHADCFPMMITKCLEKTYGAKIEYINTAVGGWCSGSGLEAFDERVVNVESDLLILGFGMNDIHADNIERFLKNTEEMILRYRAKNPESEIVLVSTMLPNVETNWMSEKIGVDNFEKILLELEKKYPFTAVANMTQMHRDILATGKRYRDMTGNDINHPNDFIARVYAQVILKTLVGKNA